MFKCEICQREFKNKLGIVSHSKVCKPTEEINEVEVIETIPEVINEVSSELQRRLDRLKYDIRNCYDASTRYRLECEYFELGGTREFLNK
mgnify:FL=1